MQLRLDSPYEVRVVSFSKHNGNLIAGGTASGQVVLWDITGRIEELEKPESLTQNQQMFRKRMVSFMEVFNMLYYLSSFSMLIPHSISH